ncbi:HAD family hydrolase [Paenibacillus xerothermodurans]|uniref:HAD family hydrolase n=1 Tax=Paenibacillus xerothermodurans TaxID=1977292 RepID=A0A2W1NZY7_PAEXE|nr:HAD family hydrolase [Paenibacillus xerothermodurans]PZE21042.1 HAD family hydrolase [Paenibacillus xerothermodurans]
MSTRYPLQGKKAICFDVNQTLIHQGLHFEQAFRSVWSDYAARWSQDDGFPHADALWEAYQHHWQQQKKLKNVRLVLEDLQQQCLRSALKQLNIPVHQKFTHDFFYTIRNYRLTAKSLAPGVVELLPQLSPRYKLAIISNSPRREVVHLLSRFGLDPYFPEAHIFTAQRQADKKPGTSLFKTAIRTLGLSPRQVVMVGNSWKHDVCGAAKAGMDSVWIQRQEQSHPPKIDHHKLGKRNVYGIQQIIQLLELFA